VRVAYYEVLCAWLLELYTEVMISLLEASGFLAWQKWTKAQCEIRYIHGGGAAWQLPVEQLQVCRKHRASDVIPVTLFLKQKLKT